MWKNILSKVPELYSDQYQMDALTSATTMLDRGHESLVPMVRFLTEAT